MAAINGKIDKNSEKYREYIMKKTAVYKIVVFLVMLTFGAVVSLIIPLRPTVSENEKRNLASFPEFNLTDFMDGTYFSQIDTWFSDTFPARDTLMLCSERLTSFYGIRNSVIHGEIVKGDEIPDVAIDDSIYDYTINTEPSDDADSLDNSTNSDSKNVNNYLYTDSPNDVSASDVGTDVEDTDGSTAAKAGETLGSIFVVGDSAYNYYAFSQTVSDRYVNMVNNLANSLSGKAKVYDMIVPTSIDVTLDDATRNSITSSSQKKAILYMYSRMGKNVGKNYIYDLLRQHRDEYIYFRTDHHWTSLGAYYAYTAFMAQLGKTSVPLDYFEKMDCGIFKGSFYTQSGINSLAEHPDNLIAYKPFSTNRIEFINRDNDYTEYNIVTDVSNWNATSKYSAFIGGDNPYSVINNPQITDGSTCLIVKESYGNAIAPFVTENFETVYIVDYRYYEGTVSQLVEENNIDTVLLLNNITATSTEQRVIEMEGVCR